MTKAAVAATGLLLLLRLGCAGSSAFLRSPTPPLKTQGGAPPRIHRREGLCLQQPPVWAGKDGERFEDVYELGRELGRGGFGIVHLATHRISKRTFAAKTMNTSTPERRAMAHNEVEMMALLGDHPNVVKIHLPAFEEEGKVRLVMDLCEGGDLMEFCDNTKPDALAGKTGKRMWRHGDVSFEVTERVIANMAEQMLSGIAHMHSMGVAHKDIHINNFMLVHEPGPDGTVEIKICDFGLSCLFRRADGTKAEVARFESGEKKYFSPEVLRAIKSGNRTISFCPTQSDMWAAGVVCYRLLCDVLPFTSESVWALWDEVWACDVSFPSPTLEPLSEEVQSFLSALIVVDLTKRMSAPSAMLHAWIQGISNSP